LATSPRHDVLLRRSARLELDIILASQFLNLNPIMLKQLLSKLVLPTLEQVRYVLMISTCALFFVLWLGYYTIPPHFTRTHTHTVCSILFFLCWRLCSYIHCVCPPHSYSFILSSIYCNTIRFIPRIYHVR
jgi:hypothetical protein